MHKKLIPKFKLIPILHCQVINDPVFALYLPYGPLYRNFEIIILSFILRSKNATWNGFLLKWTCVCNSGSGFVGILWLCYQNNAKYSFLSFFFLANYPHRISVCTFYMKRAFKCISIMFSLQISTNYWNYSVRMSSIHHDYIWYNHLLAIY